MPEKECCQPSRNGRAIRPGAPASVIIRPGRHLRDCVPVPGGWALRGTERPVIAEDFEGPPDRSRVDGFWIERGAVSVEQFRRFIHQTDYVTVAERFGWSFVFYAHISGGAGGTLGVDGLEWWRRIDGATWRMPAGPDGAQATDDMPVTHVSWEDARAFAGWAGGRLPREVEWEHAARGGLGDVRYPWGDEEPDDTRVLPCNIWQGDFPQHDTGADGYVGPAPIHAFAPNGYGLYQMVGNVWEWTAEPFRVRSSSRTARDINAARRGQKLLKGGSFLCHRSYCHRYRIAARTGNTPDSTSAHSGFRIVYDSPPA